MSPSTRRDFVQQSALGIAGAAALTWAGKSRAAAANERLRIGLIGCGGRGPYDAGMLAEQKDCEITYLADPHAGRLAEVAKRFPAAKPVADLRRVLDDKSVDAVIVATPVHWHAPASILACDAGKHVYVEKPCSHNVREGRLMVEAARRNDRVVQHGIQSRSTPTIMDGVKLLNEGIIGEVLVAKTWNIQRRSGAGPGKPANPPEGLDYDLWLGPAPMIEYHDGFFGNWNWLRRFGTGEIGNDGVHDIDYARWGLGVDTHPTFISAAGGRYFFDNAAEFPDTQQVCYEYAAAPSGKKKMLIYEERLWSTTYPHNCDSGVEFYGSEGQMFLSRRGKIEVISAGNERRKLDVPLVQQDTKAHAADFVDAIRNHRRPNADVELAHLTSSLCHLGNIALQVGRALRFDPAKEQFSDADTNADANGLLARAYRPGHFASPQGV